MTTHSPEDFRNRLVESQPMTPTMRDAYREELDKLLNEKHTAKSRSGAIILLVICVAVVVGEIRALLVYPRGVELYVGGTTMLIACAVVAFWVIRDLRRGQSARKQTFKVSELFYGAASILLVTSLMHGLSKPADPASTFNAFYVYVFLFVCAVWGIANRITAAVIETREHLLRVESRIADLVERLPKG